MLELGKWWCCSEEESLEARKFDNFDENSDIAAGTDNAMGIKGRFFENW